MTLLGTRWYGLRHHPVQARLYRQPARFSVVPAGRRSGKTEIAKRRIVRTALGCTADWHDPRFFFGAPTRDQAKSIYWSDLKLLVPERFRLGRPRETDLTIRLINGVELVVVGMDKPQRIEGRPWDGGVLDEYANMRASAWTENVRPALAERRGFCWFVGVPEGRNHYYDLDQQALADETGTWGSYSWPSADILDPEEVEAARRDMDDLTFEQEFGAKFVTFSGRAYHAFDERRNCDRLDYQPRAPLLVCFDFNVDPGVASILQQMVLPSGHEGLGAIGEVFIERASNTERVVRKLLERWGDHPGRVVLFGDATGGSRGTAKLQGSDWEIIRNMLRPVFGARLTMDVPAANPSERARINAVNSLCRSAAGDVRFMVDAARCPHTVRDLAGVTLIPGSAGEIDKTTNPKLTHLSDAIGYCVSRLYPITERRRGTTRLEGVY
jgi:hypothetical protein